MEVTVSNLRHEHKIHWRLLEEHATFSTSKIHMVIAPQQREGDPASTELAVQTFAHSLVIARVSIPFGFFLSPNLLEVLADAIEVYGKAESDQLATYAMRLERGGRLILCLSTSVYQRLGVEGESLGRRSKGNSAATRPEDDFPYKVTIDLCEMQPGRPKRTRLLQQTAMVWGEDKKFSWTFVCSKMAWARLEPLLVSQRQKMTLERVDWSSRTIEVPTPPSLAEVEGGRAGALPTEEIEELSLWMGLIACDGLLMNNKKVDPFISTCSWPSVGAEVRPYHHYTIKIPGGIMPASKACELIESLVEARSGAFYMSGNDGLGRRGFLMQVSPSSGNFFFGST